jgi:hypothetical protein
LYKDSRDVEMVPLEELEKDHQKFTLTTIDSSYEKEESIKIKTIFDN